MITHGTRTAYVGHKCRCADCKRANRDYNRKRAEISLRSRKKRLGDISKLEPIPCACGCGRMIPPITRGFKPARYAWGHNPDGKATQFTSERVRGAANANWKGGRKIHHTNGYVMVYVGTGHPMARSAGASYGFEHRVVMSEAIGRPLRSDEEVHHMNGDRADNRLANLQLLQRSHGTGAAFRCCDCGSVNVAPVPLSVNGGDPDS